MPLNFPHLRGWPAAVALCWLIVLGLNRVIGAPQNVLLIIADDIGVDSSAFYNTATAPGYAMPPTPNLQSLAASGVVFRNAYANPVCSPTRSCVLTGQHGFRTGIGDLVDFGSPLTATAFTLPEAFAAAGTGHHLAQFGKWHLAFGPNTPRTVGGWTNFAGSLPGAIANYTNWTKVVNGVATAGITNYATTELVNDAITWIQGRGTNAWFVWAAFNAPHSPFQAPPPQLCPSYPLNTLTNNRRLFEAMTEAMDTEIGRLLAAVDRTNTHVIFLGDNGTPGSIIAPPFSAARGKDTLYEGGTHVPLIISGPTVVSPNRTNDTPVNAVDLFSTILELAGTSAAVAVPGTVKLDSQSLVPLLTATNSLPRRAYTEMFGTNVAASVGGRALRDDRYKVIQFANGTEEFYDLTVDPLELTNLVTVASAGQKAYYDRLLFQLNGYSTNVGAYINTAVWTNGQFSCTLTQSAGYTLWRCTEMTAGFWAPVTNAMATTNSSTLTLIDPNPPAGGAFYRVVK